MFIWKSSRSLGRTVHGSRLQAQILGAVWERSTESRYQHADFRGGLQKWKLKAGSGSVVCSGSVVVTAYDFESSRPGSNPEWGQYTIRLRSLHRAYPSLHPSEVVLHWAPEQLNIKSVTGHASWLMVAALKAAFGHRFTGIMHMSQK